jgi:multidrug efflux pump subunit AcrA (membrane-fusion protein)
MKKYFLFALILSLFSCTNKDDKNQNSSEKTMVLPSVQLVIGIGEIIPENDIIEISSPVNGIVQKIYKNENDPLSTGSIILELDYQLEEAKLMEMVNQVTTQTAQIKVDQANVDDFEGKYDNAKTELRRLQNLLEKGAETQQNVDNAATDLHSYKANLDRLRASVLVSKSKLEETKASLKVAEIERDQKIIRSPVDGQLLELNVLIGSAVDLQNSIAKIKPEGSTISLCEIDELYANKIKMSQKAWVRNVGSLDTLSTGTVYFTSGFLKKKSLFTDVSGEKEDRLVRTIKIMLDHPENLLLNQRVECVVEITNP